VPRKRKSPPKAARRQRGSGSLSVAADGTIRARLPACVDVRRPAREFRPGQLAEATAWLDGHLNHVAPPTTPADITLEAWAGQWWETYVEPVSAPNTARHYLYLLQQLAPLYGRPVAEIRPSALQGIVAAFAARVGAATAQQAAGVWRRMLEAAVDDELIVRNPAKRLVLPKAPPRSARRHVTPREAAMLRAAIVGHRFEAAYALLLGCGLRIGEVLGLSWANVDLHGRRAWIQRQWTNGQWRELPKGRNPHWIRLPPAVVSALIRHRNAQPDGATLVMQSPYRRKKTGAVQPWSAFVVATDLHALVRSLGLDDLTPHAARHGLASALLDGGASPAEIAERLGHSDPAITLRSYVHGSQDGAARADALIDAYLSGGEPSDDQTG
jgi:integrase